MLSVLRATAHLECASPPRPPKTPPFSIATPHRGVKEAYREVKRGSIAPRKGLATKDPATICRRTNVKTMWSKALDGELTGD